MLTDSQPVQKTVTVDVSQQRAFEVFTAQIGTWWPAEYHIGASDPKDFIIEPKAGGRWYEIGVDGSECDTGRVTAFEPPNRVVLAWHITESWQFDPDPARASEVEIRLVPEGPSRTRVELEHRNIERHGAGAQSIHDTVDGPGGWDFLLPRYAAATA